MTQSHVLRDLKSRHWRHMERLLRQAYQEGLEAGVARARGQSRRGRTIRADATVEGLLEQIDRHFGLERFGFEVRIVHGGSGRRVPAVDLLSRYRRED